MFGRIIRTVVIITIVVLASAAWAQAQAPVVDIKFGFVAGGKTLAAGSYAVDVAANGNVVFTPEKGGTPFEVPQMKVLSKRNVARAALVFDVVGSARFLSEVWLPGKGGTQVGRQSEAQERETVKGPKAAK